MGWKFWGAIGGFVVAWVALLAAAIHSDSTTCAEACEADGRAAYSTGDGCWCLDADGSAFKPKPGTMPATSPVCK